MTDGNQAKPTVVLNDQPLTVQEFTLELSPEFMAAKHGPYLTTPDAVRAMMRPSLDGLAARGEIAEIRVVTAPGSPEPDRRA